MVEAKEGIVVDLVVVVVCLCEEVIVLSGSRLKESIDLIVGLRGFDCIVVDALLCFAVMRGLPQASPPPLIYSGEHASTTKFSTSFPL
jgi:hypothetical protein